MTDEERDWGLENIIILHMDVEKGTNVWKSPITGYAITRQEYIEQLTENMFCAAARLAG
jgi:hypothetical protein